METFIRYKSNTKTPLQHFVPHFSQTHTPKLSILHPSIYLLSFPKLLVTPTDPEAANVRNTQQSVLCSEHPTSG